MSATLCTSRLPSVTRILSRKAPPALSRKNLVSKKTLTTTAFQVNPIWKYASQCTARSLSTKFREDYDDWYSHGCTGHQTQYDEGNVFFPQSSHDAITFGVQPVSEMQVEDIVYDLEDEDVDYSDEDFENFYSHIDKVLASVKEMEYHPNIDSKGK
ncbi:MAG: hypothetical protein SGBAC_001845 [Bacillariaceae sp.]